MLYGIIWYEHYGSDLKRTLINRLITSLSWIFVITLIGLQESISILANFTDRF
jgi:hypothetical protein